MRRGIRRRAGVLAVLAAAAAPLVSVAAVPVTPAGAGALRLPDPCTLTPVGSLAATLDEKTAPKGTGSTSNIDGFTVRRCAWTHGAVKVNVAFAPAAYGSGGFGGPPGMVVERKPAGLGPDGLFTYDTNPRFRFADANFVHGLYWGDAHSNGPDSPGSVLALARAVYRLLH